MLPGFEYKKRQSPRRDYFVLTTPIPVRFSGQTASSKRRSLAKSLTQLFEAHGLLHSASGYGSAYYGGARDNSDTEIAGITKRKRPFRTELVARHPETGEAIRVTVFGFPIGYQSMTIGTRTTAGITRIPKPYGFTSLSLPRLFSKGDFERLASVDAIDLVRRSLHNLYSHGKKSVTETMVLKEILKMENRVNPAPKRLKSRLQRGLGKLLLANVKKAMQILPLVEKDNATTKKKGSAQRWRINDKVTRLELEPEEIQLDNERIAELKFERTQVKPLVERYILPLLSHKTN